MADTLTPYKIKRIKVDGIGYVVLMKHDQPFDTLEDTPDNSAYLRNMRARLNSTYALNQLGV